MKHAIDRTAWRDTPHLLREASHAHGLKLHEVAALTGKSFRTVYAYSRQELEPPDEWLEAFNHLLSTYEVVEAAPK